MINPVCQTCAKSCKNDASKLIETAYEVVCYELELADMEGAEP